MAIDFPNSPTSGDSYTVGDKSWQWDGAKWIADGAFISPSILKVDQANSRVGIGTATPQKTFHMEQSDSGVTPGGSHHAVFESSADNGLLIASGTTSNGRMRFGDSDSAVVGGFDYDHADDSLKIRTAGTDHLTIDSSGNVGIGTSTPDSPLHIETSATTDTELLRLGGAWSTTNRMAWITGVTTTDDGVLARIGLGTDPNGGNNNDGGIVFQTTTAANTTGSTLVTAMTIDDSGNVGIGTTAPDNVLHLHGTTGNHRLVFTNSNNTVGEQGMSIGFDTDRMSFQRTSDTGAWEANYMVIDQDTGNVMVGGTTQPGTDAVMYTEGVVSSYNPTTGTTAVLIKAYSNVGGTQSLKFDVRANGDITTDGDLDVAGYSGFGLTGATVRIHLPGGTPTNANSGIAAAWNVHSSIRWKDNVETVTGATAVVNALRPVTFQYKDPETGELSETVEYGFIAEEVRDQIPSVVQDDPDDPEFAQSVDYARLTSLLTAAIQEQQTQIDALTARIETLEAV